MKSLTRLLGATALAAAVASATHAQDLSIGMSAQSAGPLDPHVSTATGDKIVFAMLFNGLVRFRPGSMNPADIEPDLAESWTASDDGLVWTFILRDDVTFHGDYGALTAEDVAFSLQRAANPDISSVSSDYSAFESIEAIDDRTVRITLSQPIPSVLGVLANYHGGMIVSKAAVEALGESFSSQPVGTGPFEFAELNQGEFLRLVANEDYFRGAPRLQSVTYRYVPSASGRELAFGNGELDLFYGTREDSWIERMRSGGTQIDVFEPSQMRTLHLNRNIEPLNDIRVRQAIAHAINRAELVAFVGSQVSREATSPVPAGYLGHVDENGILPHDLDRARALLAEAGYPDGITIPVAITESPDLNTTMQVLQAQLAKAGITLELQVMEHRAWHAAIRDDASSLVLYGAARFPVADTYLTQFYHSDAAVGTPTAVTNFSHCSIADEQIAAARSETDPAEQLRLWQDAQRLIVEDVCSVPLFELLEVWARSPNVDLGYDLTGAIWGGPAIDELTSLGSN